MSDQEGSASPAQNKVIVSVPKATADTIDAIGANIDAAQAELAEEVRKRFGVTPPVRSLTRPQIVEMAVNEMLAKQDAAFDAIDGDPEEIAAEVREALEEAVEEEAA
jgi:hypothetical protein